jgi:plasmid replication initiation protein
MDLPRNSADENFQTKIRTPGQNSLFPTEDLIIPESVLQLKKAVSAIHSYPSKGDRNHTLNTRKLFDAAILIMQMDIRSRKDLSIEKIRSERISPVFETRITNLVTLAGIAGKNYQRVYQDLDHLYEMPLTWNIVGEDSNVIWKMKSHFFSSLGIGEGNKRGLIRFSMDPEILAILLEPTNWAMLSMQVLRSLKMAAAHALYQNTFRYLGTAKKVTAQLPIETWVNLTVGPSRYLKKDSSTGDDVVNYKEFKRFILVPAIEQINTHPALNYTLKLHERRSGNRVAALQFSFERKQQHSLDLPFTWSDDTIRILNDLGFTDAEISDMSQAHAQTEIVEALMRLPKAEQALKAKGVKLSNKQSYFAGILAKVHEEFSPDKDAQEISDQVNKKAEEEAAASRKAKIDEAFAEHQSAKFRESFLAMNEQEKAALISQFEQSKEGLQSATQMFIAKGWKVGNKPLFSVFRAWAKTALPGLENKLLPFPQDQTVEAWSDWKITG